MPQPEKDDGDDSKVKLRVGEVPSTRQEDIGSGIVRIDSKVMEDLGIREGDVVNIEGKRQTAARVARSLPQDAGLGIIRMDGYIRKNAGTSLGEKVEVSRSEIKEAKKVVLAPAEEGVIIQVSNPSIFKRSLKNMPVTSQDIIAPGSGRKRRRSFFEDMFDMDEFFSGFGLGDTKLMVVSTNPQGPVIITEATDIEVKQQATEAKGEARPKVPEVTYEDIGGLDSEIEKVREMIELPLKHPEVFQQLGIDAPSGVLLRGPPGTGKTLIAKAVANEADAYFNSIKGPEIMCVGPDTQILTNPEGCITAEQIFDSEGQTEHMGDTEVKELDNPINTWGFQNGEVVKTQITHATKLKAPAYNVELGDGNSYTVSTNQPFLTYRNGEFVWKRTEDLEEGDFVARINQVDTEEKSRQFRIEDIENLVEEEGRYSLQSHNLDRSNFLKLPEESSKELLEFLGLIVSEGSIHRKGDGITFANSEPRLKKRFRELSKKLFDIEHFGEHDMRVVIYSTLLVKYLRLIGFSYQDKLTIPSYFYKLPKEEIEAFVKGYMEGDGTVSISKAGDIDYPSPYLYSKDRSFLQELQTLMQIKLDISTAIRKHETPKGMMHKLVVRGFEGRRKFAEISDKGPKFEKMQQIREVERRKEHENIPRPEALVEELRDKLPYKEYRNHDYYIYNDNNFTKHAMERLYNIAERNGVVNKAVKEEQEKLQREDIAWEEVTKIEEKGETELYDFTAEHDSFSAGLTLMHNSKFYGESEKQLRDIFEEARDNSPAIIFIDELDSLAPKRSDGQGEVEKRVVSQLLSLMDGLEPRENVIVIAATNRPDAIDEALRRPGRFDREIEIGVPDRDGRKEIFQIHTRNMPLEDEVDIEELSDVTHGYVGADIEAVCKEAAMTTLRRVLPGVDLEDDELNEELLDKLVVSMDDMKDGVRLVEPSAMREVLVQTPKVSWEDVGGLEEIEERLKEMVEWPLKNPEAFKNMGIDVPKGLLLYGLPGTGKTMLAKAVANETNANFISIKGPEIFCLAPDTPIITDYCGRRTIEEFFERAKEDSTMIKKENGIEVYRPDVDMKTQGINQDGAIEPTRIKKFYRIPVENSFEIDFDNLTSIHVSANQPFLTIEGDELTWKTPEELNEGDYVASPERIDSFDKDRLELDQLGENYYVRTENGLKPLEESDELQEMIEITYARKLTTEEKTIKLPTEMTEELAELLGWIAAEGSLSRDGISIAASDPANRKRVKHLLTQLVDKDRVAEYEDKLSVYSTVLKRIMHDLFDFPEENKTSNVEVPACLFKCSTKNLKSFLRGAYIGDGYIGSKKIEYCSKSRELVNGVSTALAVLGFTPRRFQDKKGYWHVNLSGKGEISRFKAKIMDDDISNEEDHTNKKRPLPDLANTVKELKEGLRMTYGRDIDEGKVGSIIQQQGQFGKKRARGIIDQFKERVEEIRDLDIEKSVSSLKKAKKTLKVSNKELKEELGYDIRHWLRKNDFEERHKELKNYLERIKDQTLANPLIKKLKLLEAVADGDLNWIRVESIEKKGETTMYDVETDTGSFIGGETPLMLHNSKWVGESEQAIRKMFSKARQVAPCVLFIDEIDSIAPLRGKSADSGSSDRVVNQLLTELDGIESLEGVIVIAATNRPDIIDPAVLRPGRLDRHIYVPVPDKDARKKIFEVHTNEMPLSDDVDLEKLAEKTEKFVGSDIAHVCREAGMNALRKDIESNEVTMEDFEKVIEDSKASADEKDVKEFEEKVEEFEKSGGRGMPDYFG